MLILNACVHTMAHGILENGYIRVKDEKIAEIGPMPVSPMDGEEVYDVGGAGV